MERLPRGLFRWLETLGSSAGITTIGPRMSYASPGAALSERLLSDSTAIHAIEIRDAGGRGREMTAFVSYAKADRRFAQLISATLIDRGVVVATDWQIPIGADWSAEIEQMIDGAEFFIVVISNHTWPSSGVAVELARARARQRRERISGARDPLTIVPLYLNIDLESRPLPLDLAIDLRGIQYFDWRNEDGIEVLLNAVLEVVQLRPLSASEAATAQLSFALSVEAASDGVRSVSTANVVQADTTGGIGSDSAPTTAKKESTDSSVMGLVIFLTVLVALPVGCQLVSRQREQRRDVPSVITAEGNAQTAGGIKLAATFELMVLSREYYWKFATDDTVVNRRGIDVPVLDKLTNSGISATIAEMKDVVGVGMASCVGIAYEEVERGAGRAKTLTEWLRQVKTSSDIGLYSLNLGQYSAPCDDAPEREQRSVLIVGVKRKDVDVDLAAALRDALFKSRDAVFRDVNVERYSNWSKDDFARAFVRER